MYLNKVVIVGNLTRDPEARQLPSGGTVVSIGVATNRVWKDQSGQKQEEVEFHNVVFFGRVAEVVQQYLTKGQSVLVEGRLRTGSWDDKETGQKRYKTEIVCDQMQMGPRRNAGTYQESPSSASAQDARPAPKPPAGGIDPDDIPF